MPVPNAWPSPPAPEYPPPAVTLRGPARGYHPRSDAPAVVGVRERLAAPSAVLITSLCVALVDMVAQKILGSPLSFGPARLSWIVAPLALVGVGFLLWRLMSVHAEE